jgi:hypothetical protein
MRLGPFFNSTNLNTRHLYFWTEWSEVPGLINKFTKTHNSHWSHRTQNDFASQSLPRSGSFVKWMVCILGIPEWSSGSVASVAGPQVALIWQRRKMCVPELQVSVLYYSMSTSWSFTCVSVLHSSPSINTSVERESPCLSQQMRSPLLSMNAHPNTPKGST